MKQGRFKTMMTAATVVASTGWVLALSANVQENSAQEYEDVVIQENIQIQGQSAAETQTLVSPVVVSPSMSPAVVPAARVDLPPMAPMGLRSGEDGQSVKNTSNSGGGIQNIINLDQKAAAEAQAAQNSNMSSTIAQDESALDLKRRLRMRKEIENDGRVLEKLEEGRLTDEQMRANAIQQFNAQGNMTVENPRQNVEVVQVMPVHTESMYVPTTTSSVSTTVSTSSSGFTLTPVGGYRWFEDSIRQRYGVRNKFIAGVNIEGRVNRFIAIEGGFMYGQDDIKSQGFGTNYLTYSPYGHNPYNSGFNSGFGSGYGPGCHGCYGYGNTPTQTPMLTQTGIADRRDSYEVNAGLKLGAPVAMVRPYVAGGVGLIYQKYMYDTQTNNLMKSKGLDRSSNNILGNIGGGMDLLVNSNVSMGARFDYQAMLNKASNSRSQELDTYYGDSQNRYRLTGNLAISF
jgi:hypothetical protein